MLLKKIGKVVTYSVLAALMLSLAAIVFFLRPIDPHSSGGIARLRKLAQTSQSLRADIELYHKKHGYFPSQISDLYPDYYTSRSRRTLWYYEGWASRENSQQYSLSILPGPGHDPLLQFRRHADRTSQWVYDPGDGSPETPLSFSIKPE